MEHSLVVQLSPSFRAPGTNFVEDNFSMDQGGRWFRDDSSAFYLWCTVFLLLLHQFHPRSSGIIRSWRPGTPALASGQWWWPFLTCSFSELHAAYVTCAKSRETLLTLTNMEISSSFSLGLSILCLLQVSITRVYSWLKNRPFRYWWTYLQGRNRDADIKHRFVDTAGGGRGWEELRE